MTASSLALRAAALYILVGMGAGIFMAASADHTIAPAHAHLNLIGCVITLLMGLVYRLDPVIDASRLAVAQVALLVLASLIMFPSLAIMLYGNPAAEAGAIISSFMAIASAAIFAVNVFRITGKSTAS